MSISASKIYVADDEPANRRLLEAIFARAGFLDVRSYPDGELLLRAVEADEPDLILLDMRMPGTDGHEVLRALRERREEHGFLPVLVLSGQEGRLARSEALDGGANDYLTKPFDPAEVLLRARNLLETRRLHQQLKLRNFDLTDRVAQASQKLADREREWAQQAAALSHLEAGDTAEATAQAICDELRGISGLTSVLIVALDAGGNGVPLAHDAFADVRIGVNRPLPLALTNRWRERVASGPWVGPYEAVFGTPLRRLPHDLPTAMAIIPLRTSTALLGGLVAATTAPDGTTYLASRMPVLESFGAVASALLAPGIIARQHHGALRGELEAVLRDGAYAPVFQPVVDLQSGNVIGYEALTRFTDGTRPDRRFADAAAVGLGVELELGCLSAALESSTGLPSDRWLSLNVSPDLLLEPRRLKRMLRGIGRPIVLEVTEHVGIEDYPAFRTAVGSMGPGLRLAVDDAGAGFSSFRHILELRPQFVKLDIGLVHGIEDDDIRQALVAGIVYFARKSGCRLIAEGIETVGERHVLRSLGVELGQGYLLGRPRSVADAIVDSVPVCRNLKAG
jgi:EAL domain-containing protein (putative c-di-GMP-specific phosphodiesterase class I)/DNA-binding response OmpR family regulator